MTPLLVGVYPVDVEGRIRNLFRSMNEKDRRRYAAAEADKLGRGGITYIASLLGCTRDVVYRGRQELEVLGDGDPLGQRIRKPGAGRPRTEDANPQIQASLKQKLEHRSAGDPMDEGALWTDLSPRDLAEEISEETKTPVSANIVRRMLDALGCGLRKIAKVLLGKESPDRDGQFCHIGTLIDSYLDAGLPVISMDTKKKEFLGRLYRNGRVYTNQAFKAFDHDFPSWAEGVIIPHGLYDVARNEGHLHVGLSHDTSEFACDSIRLWLSESAWVDWPEMREFLLLCDGGGSNGARTYIFKQDLQELCDEFGICIRVAHYPPYCSKYNPIERRLFSHVTRACQGVLFDSLSTVMSLLSKTSTRTGLRVFVRMLDGVYETGRKACESFKANMPIEFDDFLPQLNYRVVPQMSD